jgi:2'-5' RNA ligase
MSIAVCRLFIAIDLPDHVRQVMIAAQADLRRAQPFVSWVAPETMHLTLCFLGDTDTRLIEPIADAMRSALADCRPCHLQTSSVGVFPNTRKPGVVWLGVTGDVVALEAIQATVATAVTPLQAPSQDHSYHPHLTLGRVRRDATNQERAALGEAVHYGTAPAPQSWLADRVTLYQSETRAGGARYTALATVLLDTEAKL